MNEKTIAEDVSALSTSIKDLAIEFLYRDGKEVADTDDLVVIQLGVASAVIDLFCALEKIGLRPKRDSVKRFIELLIEITNDVEQQEITN